MNEQTHPFPENTFSENEAPMDTTVAHEPHTWRHPVNTGHLVMGIAFAGLVAVWAIVTSDLVDSDDVRWLLPIPWVLAGAIGLAVATLGNLRARRAREQSL